MKLQRVFLLIFLFTQISIFAQVNFRPVSASVEKTINEVGPEKMHAAWFVTGQDTVYQYRFHGGKNIARKTNFDADTTWAANDSLYHKYAVSQQNMELLLVYFGSRLKRQTRFKSGKLASEEHWQHDSLGREIYNQEWNPSQMQTTTIYPNGKEEWVIEHFYNDTKTIRKQHGDTNRVWTFTNNDTTNHRIYWHGYMEVKQYHPLYVTRDWSDGVARIQVFRGEDFADSAKIIEADNVLEVWNYRPEAASKKYMLFQYSKDVGLTQLKSRYRFLPDSDTARYTVETYQVLPFGMHRKTQELRLNKDSARYKQIDYFWKENGPLDYVLTTNRWGIKRKRKAAGQENEQLSEYHHSPMHPHIKEEDSPRYYFRVLSENLAEIKLDNRNLNQILVQKLAIQSEREEWRWQEIILFEIDENRVLTAIRKAPGSALALDNLKREIGQTALQIPDDLKTTFYYTDANGKKHKKQMNYILLPVTISVQKD